jgi:hypothetical protein
MHESCTQMRTIFVDFLSTLLFLPSIVKVYGYLACIISLL